MHFKKQLPTLFLLGVILFISYLLFESGKPIKKENDLTNRDNLVEIAGLISSAPTIDSDEDGDLVSIKLDNFPEFTFTVGRSYSHKMRIEDFVQQIRSGDLIILNISKSDFEDKIERKKKLNLTDRIFGVSSMIEVYEIDVNNKRYLRLEDLHNSLTQICYKDTWKWFLGLSLLLFPIYFAIKKTGISEQLKKWSEQVQRGH